MGRRGMPRAQSGFTLTELIIASTSFAVIMGAAMALLVSWSRFTSRSEADIEAVNECTRAIAQIGEDVRSAMYLYHYATISITMDGAPLLDYELPIVTENSTADGVPGNDWPQTFFTSRAASPDLMGTDSNGSMTVLAMISDQPSGINLPRYIVYWLGPQLRLLKGRTERVAAGAPDLYLRGLYRLEASPSAANGDFTPNSWYTFKDSIATSSATSALYVQLQSAATSKLANNAGMVGATDIKYKLTKLAEVVTGPGLSDPFTLRNPHPYSNGALFSPYLATVSLRTTRAVGGLRPQGPDGRELDLFELNSQAFARNVPLPQMAQ